MRLSNRHVFHSHTNPMDPRQQYHFTDPEPMTIREAIKELADRYSPANADRFLWELEAEIYAMRMDRKSPLNPDPQQQCR